LGELSGASATSSPSLMTLDADEVIRRFLLHGCQSKKLKLPLFYDA
jgi:hypothetical protein